MKVKYFLQMLALVATVGVVVHGVASSNEGKSMGESKSLPVVTAGVGWSTKSVREASPILAKLPSSFDDWQAVFSNDAIEYRYDDGVVSFNVTRPHTFSITPEKGVVRSTEIELAPVYVEDFDAALKTAATWIDYFDQLPGIRKSTPQNARYPLSTLEQARKEFAKPSLLKRFGITVGEWRSEKALYTVIVNQTEVSLLDEATKKDRRALMYKVSLFAANPSVLEPAKYK